MPRSALTGRFPLCLMDRSARLGPCSVRGGGGGRVVALGTPPAMRDGGGGGGGGRKPQDWAWQMGQQKPAWALLIKQNEAWDHKIFCLIPGSHGGGADQLGRQRRKVYRGKPGAGWVLEQDSLGAAAEGLVQGRGWGGGFFTGLPFSLESGSKWRLFTPETAPSCWRPGTSHGPLWASISPYEMRVEPKQKSLLT